VFVVLRLWRCSGGALITLSRERAQRCARAAASCAYPRAERVVEIDGGDGGERAAERVARDSDSFLWVGRYRRVERRAEAGRHQLADCAAAARGASNTNTGTESLGVRFVMCTMCARGTVGSRCDTHVHGVPAAH
jgi:hypothetical protein